MKAFRPPIRRPFPVAAASRSEAWRQQRPGPTGVYFWLFANSADCSLTTFSTSSV